MRYKRPCAHLTGISRRGHDSQVYSFVVKALFFEIVLAPGQKHQRKEPESLIVSLQLENMQALYLNLSDRICRPFDCIINRDTAHEVRAEAEHGFEDSVFENGHSSQQ